MVRGCAAVLWVMSAWVAPAMAAPVRIDSDRVTARFEQSTVREALHAVADAAGAELHGEVVDERSISLALDQVPLEDALHRLLGAQSFIVRYGEGGRVRAILLRGGAVEAPVVSVRPPAAGVAVEPPKPAFPVALGRLFERHRPIALNEPLAQALGQEHATMPRLLDAAVADDDGLTRVLASQAVLSALERGGRYRRSFLRTLHRLETDEIEQIVTGTSGARFEALLEYLAAHSREPTLQKKAGVVLEQFRQAGATDG